MTKRQKETPSIVGDGVKETSQQDSSHSKCNEKIFQPETLGEFIELVTESGREADRFSVAMQIMMLGMEIDLFGDRLTPIRRQKMIELREEIEGWWRVESARQIQEFHKEKAARQRAERLLKEGLRGGKR